MADTYLDQLSDQVNRLQKLLSEPRHPGLASWGMAVNSIVKEIVDTNKPLITRLDADLIRAVFEEGRRMPLILESTRNRINVLRDRVLDRFQVE